MDSPDEAPITLRLVNVVPADPALDRVLTEHSVMVERPTGRAVGSIRLRLSNDDGIRLYAGHIGYGVDAPFRGHRYATYACLALKPVVLARGFRTVWITCDPDNWASRRTCEHIGAELIEVIDLPADLDMYRDGERRKCRYRWQLD